MTRRASLAPLHLDDETAADEPTEPTETQRTAQSTAAPELIRAMAVDRALASQPTPAAVTPRSRSATVPPLVANIQAEMSKTADAIEPGDPDRGFALQAAPTRQRRARLELPPRLEDGPVGLSPGEVSANAQIADRPDRVLAPRRISPRTAAELGVAKFRDRAPLSKRVTGDPPALNTTAVVAADAYFCRSERKDNDGDRPSPKTEKGIEFGLDFLARYQSPQGSWSLSDFGAGRPGYANELANPRSDTAATGLALSAFLGAGY